MTVLGHNYRDTWYSGQRCHCCNLTDEGIEAARAILSTNAYRQGIRDGAEARREGEPAGSCNPAAHVGERYCAMYRNGWEHAYRAPSPVAA
jgi:hypothetical protein